MLTIGPQKIIAVEQAFTDSWVDLGDELDVRGMDIVALWLELDVNDSEDMRVRAQAKHASGAIEYSLPIRIVTATDVRISESVIEFSNDQDQKIIVGCRLDGIIPIVQFQIQAGTPGLTPGQVDSAVITLGY